MSQAGHASRACAMPPHTSCGSCGAWVAAWALASATKRQRSYRPTWTPAQVSCSELGQPAHHARVMSSSSKGEQPRRCAWTAAAKTVPRPVTQPMGTRAPAAGQRSLHRSSWGSLQAADNAQSHQQSSILPQEVHMSRPKGCVPTKVSKGSEAMVGRAGSHG